MRGLRLRRVQITYVVTGGDAAKRAEDVLNGPDAWKNVDQTRAHCPECKHETAYFMQAHLCGRRRRDASSFPLLLTLAPLQVQIRSGDEAMTTFYKARLAVAVEAVSSRLADTAPPPQCAACAHQWREN